MSIYLNLLMSFQTCISNMSSLLKVGRVRLNKVIGYSKQQFNNLQTSYFYIYYLQQFLFPPHYPMDALQPTPQHLIHLSNKQATATTELTSHQIVCGIQQPYIQKQCRICLQAEQANNPLISACRCLGYLQFVHVECLQKWLQKKYQQSDNKAQFEDAHNPVCQICHSKYTIKYAFVTVWVTCSNFKQKIKINKCAAFMNLLFIVANLMCLILGVVFAVREGSKEEFEVKSLKVYMMYFLIVLTFCTSLYGIHQFVTIFMLEKIIKIETQNPNPAQKQAHCIQLKLGMRQGEEGRDK